MLLPKSLDLKASCNFIPWTTNFPWAFNLFTTYDKVQTRVCVIVRRCATLWLRNFSAKQGCGSVGDEALPGTWLSKWRSFSKCGRWWKIENVSFENEESILGCVKKSFWEWRKSTNAKKPFFPQSRKIKSHYICIWQICL